MVDIVTIIGTTCCVGSICPAMLVLDVPCNDDDDDDETVNKKSKCSDGDCMSVQGFLPASTMLVSSRSYNPPKAFCFFG